jgi:hypothetical protein
MLAFAVSIDLFETWPELARAANFAVEDLSLPFEIRFPDKNDSRIPSRSGKVLSGGCAIRVCPAAGPPLTSTSPVAGKLLLLLYPSVRDSADSSLVRDFSEFLTSRGAIAIPTPEHRPCFWNY